MPITYAELRQRVGAERHRGTDFLPRLTLSVLRDRAGYEPSDIADQNGLLVTQFEVAEGMALMVMTPGDFETSGGIMSLKKSN